MRIAGGLIAVMLILPGAASARISDGSGLGFVWPADGIVSSPFGARVGGFHPGIDIGSLQDLTVRAASAGRVAAAGFVMGYEGYGNVVVLDLGGGFTTIYAHLARPIAHIGELVSQGQTIGIAGCTGWCSGTHLHFELRDRGKPIDPIGLFGPGVAVGYTPSLFQGG